MLYFRVHMGGVTVVGVGDVFIGAGTDQTLAPIRGSLGPFVVDDLDETLRILEGRGDDHGPDRRQADRPIHVRPAP